MTIQGVPTLARALARARRLGADVDQVKGTGEVRVVALDRRLTINARRKDATRELVQLVNDLEAVQPQASMFTPDAPQAPQTPPTPANTRDHDAARSRASMIRGRILLDTRADVNGWRPYRSVQLATALGLNVTQVAVWTNYQEKQGRVQLRRNAGVGSRITHLRFTDEIPAGTPPPPIRQAIPVTPPLGSSVTNGTPAPSGWQTMGVLPTPKLAEYAKARKAAKASEYLRLDPGADTDAILTEAVRLYWWLHSGGVDQD